jgi:hypothetical protein
MKFRFLHSLRMRVALGIAFPVFVALASLSLLHYWREYDLVEEQTQSMASQISQTLLKSMRYAMLRHNHDILAVALQDVVASEAINRVRLVNPSGVVKEDSDLAGIGEVLQLRDSGCVECHQFPPQTRPRTVMLSTGDRILRIASPIPNEDVCARCHSEEKHLGILLVDKSWESVEQHLGEDMRQDFIISGVITLLIALYVYLGVHWVMVRRIEAFQKPLAEYVAGNFTARLSTGSSFPDELTNLANTFNELAGEAERHRREKAKRSELRQQAIIEERCVLRVSCTMAWHNCSAT